MDAKGKVEAYRAKLKVSFKFEGVMVLASPPRASAFAKASAEQTGRGRFTAPAAW